MRILNAFAVVDVQRLSGHERANANELEQREEGISNHEATREGTKNGVERKGMETSTNEGNEEVDG